MTAYIGQRLVFDGALCTVRYHGPVEGTSGSWLGVEWDDSTRGKHNGSHKGKHIFHCLSTSDTAASFVRPTRKSENTRTVLEAIKHKYEHSLQANGSLQGPGYTIIEISKKKVEEVGFDKVKKQMSHLENLKIVLLDQLNVVGLTNHGDQADIGSSQKLLASTCPAISELDLGWNPIEDWSDVLDVSMPLENLRVLKASGLRFKDMHARHQVSHVKELHLSECLLKARDVISLLSCDGMPVFPNLSTLWLSKNALHTWESSERPNVFGSVTSLVLENNLFSDLASLAPVFSVFPSLKSLSLQGNQISSAGNAASTSPLSTTLVELNLAYNAINSFDTIDKLPHLFPYLTSLRISKNPLYGSPNTDTNTVTNSSRPSDTPFYLTLARLPRLCTLNYTTITPRDREEGEIYYLFTTEKEIRAKLSSSPTSSTQFLRSLQPQYLTYTALCTKYDRPNILLAPSVASLLDATQTPSSTAAGGPSKSLAARLVNVTFYIPTTDKAFERALPRTTSVYTLKSLLARHFGLPPLQFRLVYESAELDPVQVTTTKLYGGTRKEWEAWGEWDVDVVAPGGEGGEVRESNVGGGEEQKEEVWVDGDLLKGGTRWRRREVEVLDGMREWGDYLDESRDVRVRVELLSS